MAKDKINKEKSNFPKYQITGINGVSISDIKDEYDLKRIILNQGRIIPIKKK